MKQSIINYLDNIKEELFSLCANLFHLVGNHYKKFKNFWKNKDSPLPLNHPYSRGDPWGQGTHPGIFQWLPYSIPK